MVYMILRQSAIRFVGSKGGTSAPDEAQVVLSEFPLIARINYSTFTIPFYGTASSTKPPIVYEGSGGSSNLRRRVHLQECAIITQKSESDHAPFANPALATRISALRKIVSLHAP